MEERRLQHTNHVVNFSQYKGYYSAQQKDDIRTAQVYGNAFWCTSYIINHNAKTELH